MERKPDRALLCDIRVGELTITDPKGSLHWDAQSAGEEAVAVAIDLVVDILRLHKPIMRNGAVEILDAEHHRTGSVPFRSVIAFGP